MKCQASVDQQHLYNTGKSRLCSRAAQPDKATCLECEQTIKYQMRRQCDGLGIKCPHASGHRGGGRVIFY